MKNSKRVSKLERFIIASLLVGNFFSLRSTWAGTTITIDGTSEKSAGYSGTAYVGVDATSQSRSLGNNVDKIQTASGGVGATVYGIKVTGSNSVSAGSISGGIDVKSTSESAYGIFLMGSGTSNIQGLGGITAETSSNKDVFGMFVSGESSSSLNVTFAGAEKTIRALSASKQGKGIYVCGNGNTTISDLKKIVAKGADVSYGLDLASGTNYIGTDSTGTTGKELTTIEVGFVGDNISSGSAAGIRISGGTNTIAFGNNSSITAKSTGKNVFGIDVNNGGVTVSGLGSITVETTSDDAQLANKTAWGIHTAAGTNVVSFKGSGATPAQAITATSAHGDAYSIYAEAVGGSTTVNFENSILSGKILQKNSGTLTLNFNNGGVWTPVTGNVSGTVAVKVNDGGKIKIEKVTDLTGGTVNVTTASGGGLEFVTPSTFTKGTSGDTMLKLNTSISIGSGVGVYVNTSALTGLVVGDVITLMDVGSTKTITLGTTTLKVWDGSSYVDTSNITLSGTSKLIYTVEEFTPPTPPTGTIIEIQTDGKSQIGGTASTYYSGTDYVGADGKVNLDAAIDQIKTVDAGVDSDVYGIKVKGDKSITVTSLKDGISVKSTSGDAYGISLAGTGTSNIQGLGSITAESSGANKTVAGVYFYGEGSGFDAKVDFAGVNSKIDAKGTGQYGHTYGIFSDGSYIWWSHTGEKVTGTKYGGQGNITVSNLGGITVNANGGAAGILSDGVDDDYRMDVTFADGNSGIIVESENGVGGSENTGVYGVRVGRRVYNYEEYGEVWGTRGKTNVKNLAGITVEVKGGISSETGGIYTHGDNGNFAVNVEFTGAESRIKVTNVGDTYPTHGIRVEGDGTTTVTKLGEIEVSAKNDVAYGIYMVNNPQEEGNVPVVNIEFTGENSAVTVKSTEGEVSGVSFGSNSGFVAKGIITVSGLDKIEVETVSTNATYKNAYGICSSSDSIGSEKNTVQFIDAGGAISAYAAVGNNYGIYTEEGWKCTTGITEVKNVKSITAGVKSDGTITTGTAYGICTTGGVNTISFKGDGGQAIKVQSQTADKTYSIYSVATAATDKTVSVDTTVNFENTILSGKIYQGVGNGGGTETSNLTLNFNDKGTWRPKADDVTGTVAVTVNNGGSIDTRTYDAQGKVAAAAVKTVDLKDCTLTFADGAKINADAVVTNDGVTMDNFTVKAASGTISLADLNINDSAVTTAWTGVKEVDLLTGDCSNVTFTQSVVESTNYTYTFTLGSASAQKLTLNVAIEETDLSSVVSGGSDKTSYKLKKDEEVLKKDLGTLDNSKRESFTIEGDGKTLVANGYKGVTITKDTDKMYVNNITVKGFDTFATVEAGELILKDVTFTDSTTADVVNNSAHTVIIDGTVTLDKGIAGEGRVVQKEGSTLEVDVTNPPDNAYINASKLDIENNTTISLKGAKEWGYYKLVSGDAAKDGNIKLWDNVVEDLKTEGFWGEFDLKDGVITMEFRNIPLGVEANTSALAGVQQGAITMVNQIADTIGENVGIIARPAQEGVYDKTIWANYINSKETVNGMSMWRGTGDNTAKYHGVTVGADFYTTKKAIAGVALTYVTGDITSNPDNTHINNKTKYYGISFYDRVTNGKGAWTYDLGYSQGKNEISQNSYQTVTADAKTNAYTLGAKYEYAYNFKHSSLVPFASLRYLRLNSKDYTNSNGHNMNINKQNLIVPKLGLAWTGNFEMPKSGWNFKPVAEVGYIWNLKGREADGTFTARNGVYNVAYDTVDKSSYYTKLGLNFNKKNFTGGVSYRYAKGDAARQNSWNVNLSWTF